MAGCYSSDYLAELLERVLLHLVHGCEMAFALYKQGSGLGPGTRGSVHLRFRRDVYIALNESRDRKNECSRRDSNPGNELGRLRS